MSKYRVEDKKNVHSNGRRTMFKLYEKQGDAYVHIGQFTAMGWDQSDARCIADALETMERLESQG
jgi:hypothetical protein